MGSGEFGGGGSVVWEVHYDENENTNPTHGNAKGHGKDKDPETSNGKKMYVVCKKGTVVKNEPDEVIVEVTLEKDNKQVVVSWGKDGGTALNAAR